MRNIDTIDRDSAEKTYEAPTVVDYGDLREVTAAAKAGKKLDAGFTTGTPATSLTFS